MDITVITPFHNVDMNIFESCFQSMINQSMGIDNIEWIIVLHNCEQQYIDAVKEKVKPYKNVLTPVLNNDARTPSSPRNYGLTMATGEYIGFLDGDDSYLPTCLETALRNIKSSKSDILCFKREYEMEDANQVAIGEGILLDQTKESLVFNKYTWEAEKTFVSVWGMVTSKIYSHEFIKKNNLKFSEDIPFAEDAAFNLVAYPLASNICYLTQYVGYHYFINSGSLVQCSAKDAKTLISYAKGYEKIFSIGMKNGLFMNNMIGGLLYHIARFLEVSEIDTESRKEIRDILLPYLRIVKPFDVCEIYTEDDVKLRYNFPKTIIPDVKDISIWEDDSKKAYPLTYAQKYQRSIMEADGFGIEAIEMDRFYEISGDVDEEKLRKAVKDTLDAHDVYRIRVKDSVMKISDDMPVASLYYFTEKLFKEYRSISYSRHIDSENEPPMQIDVICCVEDFSDYNKDAKNELVGKKYLHVKASHYVYDQVSLCNLFNEITNRYNETIDNIPEEKITIFDISLEEEKANSTKEYAEAKKFFNEQYKNRGSSRIFKKTGVNTFDIGTILDFISAEEFDAKVREKNLTTGVFLLGMFEKTLADVTGKTDFSYMLLSDDRGSEEKLNIHGVLAKGVYITSSICEFDKNPFETNNNDLKAQYYASVAKKAKGSIANNIIDFKEIINEHKDINSLMTINYIGKNKFEHRLFGKELKRCFSAEHANAMKAFSALSLSIEKVGSSFNLVGFSDSLTEDDFSGFIEKFEENIKGELN